MAKIKKVKKRDGAIVDFNKTKIKDAVYKAITAVKHGDGKDSQKITDKITKLLERRFKKDEIPTVEQIQDIVEEALILEGLVEPAKAFILYREQRRKVREAVEVSEKAVDRIDDYLGKLDWEIQENANMSFSLQGLNRYGISYIVKKYWLNKIYPEEIRKANQSCDLHLHNLDTLGCYTFFGREVVVAKLGNKIRLVSLKNLYDEIEKNEKLLSKKDKAFAKYPDNLYVLDRDGWTRVKRMVRKKKHREMQFVKSEQGRSIIVTDNHPFIVKRNDEEVEVEAKDVKEKKDSAFSAHIPSLLSEEELFQKDHIFLAEELLENNYQKFFLDGFEWQDFQENWGGSSDVEGTLSTSNSANSLDNKLELSEDLGYLVGIFTADGHYDSWRLVITNNDKQIIKKIRRICSNLGARTYIRENENKATQIAISSSSLKLVFEKVFKIKALSKNKNIPLDVLTYNKRFIKGLIAGIIDGDGSVDPENKSHSASQIVIRVVSRTMLEQVATLLQFFGIVARSGANISDIGKTKTFKGKEITQNYPLYRLNFSKKKGVDFPSFKYKQARATKKSWRAEEYDWNKVLNSKFTKIADDTIFDITTDSSTFLANGLLVHNCMGWDLYDLLNKGFGGVSEKLESKPPKHFGAALGQIVNFLYTLQGECAGAVALSNFDTLLAPFIRYDNLNYTQVKQAMQRFLHNMAVPTRVGFQCLSEDTEILTAEGWKGHEEIKKENIIKTFNLESGEIEDKKVLKMFSRDYKGKMYRLKNRIQDQLISPEHRVVRKKFNTENYTLEPIEETTKLKSPFIIPIAGKNSNPDTDISDEQIKLMAWIISEGSIEKPGKNYRSCHRVSIYQSRIKNKENYEEIINLFQHFGFEYTDRPQLGLGEEVRHLRLNAESSKEIHQWFGSKENVHFIPDCLLDLSQRQSRLFLETYLKADGSEDCKIATIRPALIDDLQRIVVNAGYGFTVLKRKPLGVGKKYLYILRIIRHKETYISKVEKVDYEGTIWCPTTENGTLIARRKGKVFVTGNCPFTNVTLDLKPSAVFADQPVIIGGKPQEETYGEFESEMQLLIKAFYEVILQGDKSGRPFHFPIPTINITKDFPWGSESADLIFKASAKYGTNYFANYINSEMKPSDVRSMCCRLRLDLKDLHNRGGGGLFGAGSLTGSIGVVTINLPRIAYLSKTKKEFLERLEKLMDLAKESLEIKRKSLEDYIEKGLYPYSRFYLSKVKKMRGGYYANHFSTIGLVGMNETCLNFLGKDIATKKGQKLSLSIMDFMRDKLKEYQEGTGHIYNLEATPAESTAYRLAIADKAKYPDIITAGTEDNPYYTNSTQLPVNYTTDAFEALDLQDELQCKYTGGTVEHLFLGERIKEVKSAKKLVKTVFEKYHLPYITLTPTFSICPVHGYLSGEHFTCPKCAIEQPCEVYSRIVGYLRPVKEWNEGKKQEYKERKEFKNKESISKANTSLDLS